MRKVIKGFIGIILMLFILGNSVQAASLKVNTNSNKIKVGEEITVKIAVDEKFVTTDFHLNYNKDCFEYITTKTDNTNIKGHKENGYVLLVYADITGKGTKQIEVIFKAVKETTEAVFSVDNVNMVTSDGKQQNSSITGTSESITVNTSKNANGTSDGTTKPGVLPNAGKGIILIIVIIALMIIAVFLKKKERFWKKVLPVIMVAFVTTTIFSGNHSFAYNKSIRIARYDKLIGDTNIYAIMLNSQESNKQITVKEIKQLVTNIKTIKNKDNQELIDSSVIGTGSNIMLEDKSQYQIILYGDVNGDGRINSNDIYPMIQHILKQQTLTDVYAKAANLRNKDDTNDEKIDKEDIDQHINFLLGNMQTELVEEFPKSESETDASENIGIYFQKAENEMLQLGDKVKVNIVLGTETLAANCKVTRIQGNEEKVVSSVDVSKTTVVEIPVEKDVTYQIVATTKDKNGNVSKTVTAVANMKSYASTAEGLLEINKINKNRNDEITKLNGELQNLEQNASNEKAQQEEKAELQRTALENDKKLRMQKIQNEYDVKIATAESTFNNDKAEIQARKERGEITQEKADEYLLEATRVRNSAIEKAEYELTSQKQEIEEFYQKSLQDINEKLTKVLNEMDQQVNLRKNEIEYEIETIKIKATTEIKNIENKVVIEKSI